MTVPHPTRIYRFIHIDNLHIYLKREGLYAPNHEPRNGLVYRTIHNTDIQRERRARQIPCGPQGTIHDYVSFYFGPRSPMLYQLHTGWNTDYREGQEPLIYLVSTVQTVKESRSPFVFSDGHGIARYTRWYDNLEDLDKIDWDTVYASIWKDTVDDMDRLRRKQAEFLVYQFCEWSLIENIAVLSDNMRRRVEDVFSHFPARLHRPVEKRPEWYY